MEPTVEELSKDIEEDSKRIEKTCREFLELREKFITLCEKEVFPLREQFNTLDSSFKFTRKVIGVIIALSASFGVATYLDLDELIRKAVEDRVGPKVSEATNRMIRSSEALQQAVALARDEAKDQRKKALPQFQELFDVLPENEVIFCYLADLYLGEKDYKNAHKCLVQFKQALEDNKRKIKTPGAHLNCGFIKWINAFTEPSSAKRRTEEIDEARKELEKAYRISGDSDQAKRLSAEYLVLLSLSDDDTRAAKEFAYAAKKAGAKRENWNKHTKEDWFGHVKERHGGIDKKLNTLLSAIYPKEKPVVETK